MFEVRLLKNTSGLGFSFSREENIPDEPLGSSMVRVKKLFPGQPAAESGRIRVGDVIMRVNQTKLKGLSQHVSTSKESQRRMTEGVSKEEINLMWFFFYLYTQEVISALRGTGQEVTLLLCRPEPGVLSEMDTPALVGQQQTWSFFYLSQGANRHLVCPDTRGISPEDLPVGCSAEKR